MLGATIAITKVTSKVAICSYVNKILLNTTMAEYKLEFAYSIPNIIAVIKTMTKILNPAKLRLLLS